MDYIKPAVIFKCESVLTFWFFFGRKAILDKIALLFNLRQGWPGDNLWTNSRIGRRTWQLSKTAHLIVSFLKRTVIRKVKGGRL